MKRIVNLQTGEITDVELSEEEILEREAKEAYARDILPSILLENLRSVRNKLLAESDWTQVPDSPLTEEQRGEWRTYRQELRNLPSSLTEEQYRELVRDENHELWPVPPT